MKKARAKIRGAKYRSNPEKVYAGRLEVLKAAGEILWYDFEPLSLRLGKGCFYIPDFIVVEQDLTVVAIEIKGGYVRRQGMVKFKSAVKQYPWMAFEMWQYTRQKGWVKTQEER